MKQTWWQFTSIFLGMSICLSDFMVGQVLAREYGAFYATLAVLIGNIALFIIALIKAKMSCELKLTTMQVAQRYFGASGTVILSFVFLGVVLGWFGIELNLAAESVSKSFELIFGSKILPTIIANISLGFLITIIVSLYELKGMERVARWAMPIFIATLCIIVFKAWQQPSIPTLGQTASWGGISLVFATAITAVIDLPVFFRLARSNKDAYISSALFLLVILPLIELIGVYTALKNQSSSFVDLLTTSSCQTWQLWVALFLIAVGWTSNSSNVYSSAIILNQIIPKIKYKACAILAGCLGIAISCLTLILPFESVIMAMGIIVSSMGAVIIINYLYELIFKKSEAKVQFIHNQITLAIGSIFGFCSMANIISVSSFEVIDAFICAAFATTISKVILTYKYYSNNKLKDPIWQK